MPSAITTALRTREACLAGLYTLDALTPELAYGTPRDALAEAIDALPSAVLFLQ
jgi:hypothetical protein